MRILLSISLALALAVGLTACDAVDSDVASAVTADAAAEVNYGQGKDGSTCHYQGEFFTDRVTRIAPTSGGAMLTCQFKGLPKTDEVTTDDGSLCFIGGPNGGLTNDSSWRRSPGGTATLKCRI